jgi:hypothetical protein
MINSNMKHKILGTLLLLLMNAGWIQGQQIKARATLDSTRILIGDQVQLRLELQRPANIPVLFPQMPDSLAGKIEVLKRSPIDTTKLDNQNLKLEQEFLITCFDSGYYRIPPFRFDIQSAGRYDSIFTNELILNVLTLKVDTTRGPVDIKLPYEAPVTLKEVTPYLLGIILAGTVLFLLLYSIKRKKKNLPVFVRPLKPKEPAHMIALRELDRIKEEKLWQKGKIKEYYSDVTGVLRTYMEERFGIPAMEQTTDEIIRAFISNNQLIQEKLLSNLNQMLPLADLVKFAKYQPLPDDHNLVLVNAYFFVNETTREQPQKPSKPEDTEEKGDEFNVN